MQKGFQQILRKNCFDKVTSCSFEHNAGFSSKLFESHQESCKHLVFSCRFGPHSRERWSVVSVGVVVHYGRKEAGRGADRQRALGQVWTQLLLQVTSKANTSSQLSVTNSPDFITPWLIHYILYVFKSTVLPVSMNSHLSPPKPSLPSIELRRPPFLI